MKRILPTAVATLAMLGCGEANETPVNSSREVTDSAEQSAVVSRAVGLVAKSDASEKLTARTVFVDDNGSEHVRFDRSFAGLRVLGGDVIVHNHAVRAPEVDFAAPSSLRGLSTLPFFDAAAATVLAEA